MFSVERNTRVIRSLTSVVVVFSNWVSQALRAAVPFICTETIMTVDSTICALHRMTYEHAGDILKLKVA